MTLLDTLGLVGPVSALSKPDRLRYFKAWRDANPDRLRASRRKNYNPQKAAEAWKKWYGANREKLLEKNLVKNITPEEQASRNEKAAEYRAKNPDRVRAANMKYYAANRDQEIRRSLTYIRNNPERTAASRKKWFHGRYHADPAFRMQSRMRSRLSEMVRKQGCVASVSLKINRKELVAHLEKQFLPGMTWENYGTKWHVDHIIPCSAFNLTDEHQVSICFSLDNLRPLWARENIQKSDSLVPEALEVLV